MYFTVPFLFFLLLLMKKAYSCFSAYDDAFYVFMVSVTNKLYEFIHDLWMQDAPIGELS